MSSKTTLQHIRILFSVNDQTYVNIQQGCAAGDGVALPVAYQITTPQTAWGSRNNRIVQWDRYVPWNSFVSITTCANGSVCSNTCGMGQNYEFPNKLLSFEINGQEIMPYLTELFESSSQTDEATAISCSDITSCCEYFTSLASIPWGVSIVVGPIGSRSFVL
jgi:hypothetical protein